MTIRTWGVRYTLPNTADFSLSALFSMHSLKDIAAEENRVALTGTWHGQNRHRGAHSSDSATDVGGHEMCNVRRFMTYH